MNTLSPRREFWLLFTLAGIQFTNILDFMIVTPLGPQFISLFKITDAQFGLLVSAYTFAAGLSGLLASTYMDKFDRKKLLLFLYIGFGIATFCCGIANTYYTLMASRVLAGIFGGVLSVITHTIIADTIAFERRGRAMSIVMTSFSVSTVAGVPVGLWIATQWGWHTPFLIIAGLIALLTIYAGLTFPSLTDHLYHQSNLSIIGKLYETLVDKNHQKAFIFSGISMMVGFFIIPFFNIFMQANLKWPAEQIPWVYFIGGACTIITARIIGKYTDQWGKVPMFSLLAFLAILPMIGITTASMHAPKWWVLCISTCFFVFMSGRMIPSMAIITSCAKPELRGTFMALNSSVQSAAMGLAAYLGGLLITRDGHHMMQGYWKNAAIGTVLSLLSIYWVRFLYMYTQQQPPKHK